ncbi:hypothetical protein Dimus_026331 [Dionaea muscipula]
MSKRRPRRSCGGNLIEDRDYFQRTTKTDDEDQTISRRRRPATKTDRRRRQDYFPTLGEFSLFPVYVKTLGGQKLELQLNPSDYAMDVRQFLLNAPVTFFFTCYDLLVHTKDGAVDHLEEYSEYRKLLTLQLVIADKKYFLSFIVHFVFRL